METRYRIVFDPLDDRDSSTRVTAHLRVDVMEQNGLWRIISRHHTETDAREFVRLHADPRRFRGEVLVTWEGRGRDA